MKDHDEIPGEWVDNPRVLQNVPTYATSSYMGPHPLHAFIKASNDGFFSQTKPKELTQEEKDHIDEIKRKHEEERERRRLIDRERNRKWWQK